MRRNTPGWHWILGFLLLSLWSLCTSAYAAEEITLFSYQQKPPYIIDSKRREGLYFDLAERLNAELPQYHFVIRQIPRKRLDYLLAKDRLDGIVLGTNPAWFTDAQRHLWSDAFIDDANMLVSRNEGQVSKLSAENLDGRRLGVISGHRYPELAELFEGKRIQREDGVSESVNLLRLQRNWIDAAVIGRRTLEFYLHEQHGLRRQLYIDQPPLRSYQRYLLVPASHARLLPDLNRVIGQLQQTPAWQARLAHYR